MICITDVNCKKHYLHKDPIAHIVEAGPNWQKISTYVKLFDGGTIEACERAAEIHAQIAAPQPPEPVKLECPKCGADRSKEPCAGNLMECAFKGEAQSAEPSKPTALERAIAELEKDEQYLLRRERSQPAETVKVPSFDDWFKERNSGLSFDEAHMGDGALIDKSMKELSRHMRDYVTELVNAKT